MCAELSLEYQEWLNQIILILNTVCEGVVPAGKPDEVIYWKTKNLYESIENWTDADRSAAVDKCVLAENREQLEGLLQQYCADGLALLAELDTDWNWKCANRNVRKTAEKAWYDDLSADAVLREEVRILLRRKYARQITGSLQMLVNFVYLLTEWEEVLATDCSEKTACEAVMQLKELFEVDERDKVKQVHAGVFLNRILLKQKRYEI